MLRSLSKFSKYDVKRCKVCTFKKFELIRISRKFSNATLSHHFEDFVQTLPSESNVGIVHFAKSKNNIGVVSIDNHTSLNAITGKMMIELRRVVKEMKEWKDGKAAILMGSNGQFCSGGDLKRFMNFLTTPELGYMMSCYMHQVMKEFEMLPFPTVALIQGHTLGGGAEIATACDYRVMCNESAIGFVQSRLGITTGFGGATRLMKILGKRTAMELLISGRKLNSQYALDIGLVDDIFPPDVDVIEWSSQWLEERGLLRLSPSLTQGITSLIRNCDDSDADKLYNEERKLFKTVWQGEEHQTAIKKRIKHK